MGTSGIQEKVVVITGKSIPRAVAYAIERPADVEIDEVVVRLTAQDF